MTVGHAVEVTRPKTARSERVVALDPATVTALRAHRKAQLEDRLAWGSQWQESGYVFVREDGAPLHPNRASKLFDARVQASGLPRIRLHDLRHTHATLALRANVHVKVVSERLGHSSTSVTLDTYSHAVPGLQEEAAITVASLFVNKPVRSDDVGG